MNKERRQRINNLILQLKQIQSEIGNLQAEEQDAFENMPEGLQNSEKGEAAQAAVDALAGAENDVEALIDNLYEAAGD